MKRTLKKKKILFLLLVFMATVTVSVGAVSVRSSLYLSRYRAWLNAKSGGEITVTIDVQAVDNMDEVGASKIILYESSNGGTSWTRVRTYLKSIYPEMYWEDEVLYYTTPVSHQGTVGYKYYAVVTVYASDSTGSDSREYETTVVTAIP